MAIVVAKSKEQDFLLTWIANSRIPDSVVGTHRMPYAPFTPPSIPEEGSLENPFHHR
jgi:hypothetical protein